MTSSGQNVDSFKFKRKWLKIKQRQYFSGKWSDTLLFNRKSFETDMHGPFHLISTPPLWMKLSEGVTKVISEGVSQSASFELAIFSEGTAQNDPFFLGEIENKAYF